MMNWERNYSREAMRPKHSKPFEWYSAEWFVISLHVHNKTDDGQWTFIIRGTMEHEPREHFPTKEAAMHRIEAILRYACKSFIEARPAA